MTVTETSIEKQLRKLVEGAGGICVKLRGYKGIPDRIAIMPGDHVVFCECKTEDGHLSAAQRIWRQKLVDLGFQYEVVRNTKDAARVIVPPRS